jgi:hypothetical protein
MIPFKFMFSGIALFFAVMSGLYIGSSIFPATFLGYSTNAVGVGVT